LLGDRVVLFIVGYLTESLAFNLLDAVGYSTPHFDSQKCLHGLLNVPCGQNHDQLKPSN